MAGMLGLPCRPCSGPWKLKFDDYYLVLTILGVLGMVRKHLRLRPTFFDADFCSRSVWELSWGAKSLLTASAESAGNPLNYSLTSKYEFVLWPHRISILPMVRFWEVVPPPLPQLSTERGEARDSLVKVGVQ
jgi:hypothetical protein